MPKLIRENISVREAACPHCGVLPSDRLLDRIQSLRELCGFPLKFTSIYRCSIYNRNIKGHPNSAHKLGAQDNSYGAVDIGLHKRYAKKRFTVLVNAIRLKFNNIEVCNGHLHFGFVSSTHPMKDALYWGYSK